MTTARVDVAIHLDDGATFVPDATPLVPSTTGRPFIAVGLTPDSAIYARDPQSLRSLARALSESADALEAKLAEVAKGGAR
jgi:hypothetical protein